MYQIKSRIYLSFDKTQKSGICNYIRALVKQNLNLTSLEILDKFIENESYYLEIKSSRFPFLCGFIDDEKLFIDGSHIKANANTHKYRDEVITKTARVYEQELQEEIEQDRARHSKKPLKEKEDALEEVHRKISTTDPESGYFHKGEHKKVFAYTANTCCDRNGFVLDFEVSAGNVHDSVSFWPLYMRLRNK